MLVSAFIYWMLVSLLICWMLVLAFCGPLINACFSIVWVSDVDLSSLKHNLSQKLLNTTIANLQNHPWKINLNLSLTNLAHLLMMKWFSSVPHSILYLVGLDVAFKELLGTTSKVPNIQRIILEITAQITHTQFVTTHHYLYLYLSLLAHLQHTGFPTGYRELQIKS